VYDTCEYVTEQETLSNLLQNWLFIEAMLQDKCEPGILSDFQIEVGTMNIAW
jgi:hypothetical protein